MAAFFPEGGAFLAGVVASCATLTGANKATNTAIADNAVNIRDFISFSLLLVATDVAESTVAR
jgi:hypothetical protein